jgi:hypothetical protein
MEGVDWIDLAQNGDRWRAFLNAASIKCGDYVTT